MDDVTKSPDQTIKSEAIIMNDILCYITTAIHDKTHEFIIQAVSSHYKIDEIRIAKKLLYSYSKSRKIKRRGSEYIRSEIEDIIDLISDSNKDDFVMPQFAASRYDSFPPCINVNSSTIEELNNEIISLKLEVSCLKEFNQHNSKDLNNNLELMKNSICELKELINNFKNKYLSDNISDTELYKRYLELKYSQSDDLLHTDKHIEPVANSNNVNLSAYTVLVNDKNGVTEVPEVTVPKSINSDTEIIPSSPKLNSASEIEVPDLHEMNVSSFDSHNDSITGEKFEIFLDNFNENNLSSASLLNFKNESRKSDIMGRPIDLYSNVLRNSVDPEVNKKEHKPRSPLLIVSPSQRTKISPIIDEEGFILKESSNQYKKRKKDETSYLTGAPTPVADVWVYKVVNGNTKIVLDYVMSKNIKVYDISKTSNDGAMYKSFKLRVSMTNLKIILNPNFWPEGVKCKRWIDYRKIKSVTFSSKQYHNSKFDQRI